MATTGMSDNDLIKLASKYWESEFAVPEKTTWDYIQEDIDEWQTAVKARSAKFMQDLPEEFDLNKIEPQGRDAVSKWFKDMRGEFMSAANKAALFDPGSFAYGDGTSKMNKIEDNMDTVSGIFDNLKKVRTESIANEGKLASRVSVKQQSLIDAAISGEIFDKMKIATDGSVSFEINGEKYTDEDIKTLPVKAYKSESAYNAIIVGSQEFKQNGIDYASKTSAIRKGIVDALNSGKETGEQIDMMFDVAGSDLNDPQPFVAQYIKATFGAEMGDGDITTGTTKEYKKQLAVIREDPKTFYNDNEQNFIDNFLMPNTKAAYDKAKLSDEQKDTLRANADKHEKMQAEIAKLKGEANKSKVITSDLTTQASLANKAIETGGDKFVYNKFSVAKTTSDGYNVKSSAGTKTFGTIEEVRSYIGLAEDPATIAANEEKTQNLKADATTAKKFITTGFTAVPGATGYGENRVEPTLNLPQKFTDAVGKDSFKTVKFIDKYFKGVRAVVGEGNDRVDLTINGITKQFIVDPNTTRDHIRAQEIMQWIYDNLKL